MANENGDIGWYDPDPRAIIPLENFHIPRSLKRLVRQDVYQVRFNSAFGLVVRACAASAPDRLETWISPEIISAYEKLHRLGYAVSVESWQGNTLVGGLYGVAVRGLFAGESMFSRRRDASKVALVHLVACLRRANYQLLDIQFMTDHLRRFGAVEISRQAYKNRLEQALQVPAQFNCGRRAPNDE